MFHQFLTQIKKLLRFFVSQLFLFLALIGNGALLISTLIFYYVEKDYNATVNSYFDSFWWGVTTITTVGYGDVVPVTVAGRIIGIILMYSGTVLFIAFVGFLVHFWATETVEKELKPLEAEVEADEEIQVQILKSLKEIRRRLDHLEGNK